MTNVWAAGFKRLFAATVRHEGACNAIVVVKAGLEELPCVCGHAPSVHLSEELCQFDQDLQTHCCTGAFVYTPAEWEKMMPRRVFAIEILCVAAAVAVFPSLREMAP